METAKDDLLKRLRRIEGQIKGIQRMIESDQCCNDVLVQVSAVKSAVNSVGGIIIENYSKECIRRAMEQEDGNGDESIEKLIDTIVKYTNKFSP